MPPVPRSEVVRIFATAVQAGSLSADDRTYLAQVVAARTGLPQPEAEKRVDEVYTKVSTTVGERQGQGQGSGRHRAQGHCRRRPVDDRCHAAWRVCRQPGRHLRRPLARRRRPRCPPAAANRLLLSGEIMRSILLWMLGIPIPIIILIALFTH